MNSGSCGWSNNVCTKCSSLESSTNCQNGGCLWKSENICTVCKTNHFFDDDGLCTPCASPACKTCTSDKNDACTSCIDGWSLDTEKYCVCSIGTLEINGSCQTCGPSSEVFCLSCTILGICDTPLDGYYLSRKGATIIACTLTNCKFCPNDICQICIGGFLLNQAGDFCETCGASKSHKCSECPNAGICNTCEANDHIFNTQKRMCLCPANQIEVGSVCKDCAALSTTNCFSCPTGNICLQANEGYYIDPTTNLAATCSAQCVMCSSSSKCDVCKPKFFPNSAGVCTACASHCKTCTSTLTNACTSCDNGYILESGSCIQCLLAATLTQCTTCAFDGKCTVCHANYVVINDYCVQCPSNSLEVSGSCIACDSGASHGCLSCPLSLSCLEPIDGYYIDTTTNKPVICTNSLNCKTCTYSTTSNSVVCTLCKIGYMLGSNGIMCEQCTGITEISSHKCSSCSKTLGKCDNCVENYFVNAENICTACASNCKSCLSTSSTQCLSCIGTFTLESGSCVSCGSSLTKCKKCTTGDTCTVCQDGYIVIGGKCVRCPPGKMKADETTCTECGLDNNCLACPLGNICTQPSSGYYVDVTGKPSACISNCQICTENSGCTLCNADYLLKSDDTCEKCGSSASTKCSACAKAGKCSICAENYFLDVDFKCTKCPDNCKACTKNLSNSCTACNTGYILESGECIQCSLSATKTKCSICLIDGKCTECQNYYLKQNDVCVACPTGCLTCSSTTICTVCDAGYMFSSGSCYLCEAGSSLTKCEVCVVANKCTKCATGYWVDSGNGNCAACISNCLSCSAASGCSKCPNGYILNDNACVKCDLGSSSYCLNCPKDGKCTECMIGYYINSDFLCAQCDSKCTSCSISDTNCQSCADGFILEGNSCQPCKPGSYTTKCTFCPTNGKCLSCEDGNYVNEFGYCTTCALNCKTCSSSASNQCLSCLDEYILEEGECIKCEKNSVKTKCERCAKGDQCEKCALTYFVNNKIKCESCSTNCKQCTTAASTECTSCLNEYILVSKSCVICSITSTLTTCATCPTDGKCSSCQESNYLNDFVCLACPLTCQRCSDENTCSLCKSGYTLTTDNKCAQSLPNCNIILGNDTTKCSSCNYGYGFTEDFFCAPEIPYCSTIGREIPSECKVCFEGYGFDMKKTCQKCTPSCKFCSDSSEVCLTCFDGYYLIYDVCLSCDSKCAACTDGETCTKCADGYYMEDTKCVKCGSEGSQCQTCPTEGKCTQCSFGYFYVAFTNKCTACYAGCKTCSSSAIDQCTDCMDGYLLATKSCNKCTEPCKTCKTSLTTCTSCLNNYIFATSICKIADCSKITTKPYYVFINDYSCTDCTSPGFKIVDSTYCIQISDPEVKINFLIDGNVKATVNCLKGNNIFYSYGIHKAALIDVPTIQSLMTTLFDDPLNFLVVGRLTNIPGQDLEWILTGLKQTGENYVFRAYCELNNYVTSPVDVNFVTINNPRAESLILYVKTSKALNSATKLTVSQQIKSLLSTTKTLWTEDDASVIQTSTLNMSPQNNVYKFSFLPDYSIVDVDPYLNAMKAFIIKNQNKYAAKLNNSVADIGINGIVVSTFKTAALVPVLISKSSVVNYSSVVVNWEQNTPGRVTVFFKENDQFVKTEKILNFNLTDAEFATLSNDTSNLIQYKFQVPADEEVSLLISNLTANTTYRIYYYGENDAIPRRKTTVMGEIFTTLNQTINGLESMKFCLIAIISLWIAILI